MYNLSLFFFFSSRMFEPTFTEPFPPFRLCWDSAVNSYPDPHTHFSLAAILNTFLSSLQPRPQGLLLVQNGGRKTPWPRLPKWLQKFVRIWHVNTLKCLCSVWTTVSDAKKQTGPPDANTNLRKSHFIMCHVTKYSPSSWSISAALARGFLRPPFWTRRRPWGRGCARVFSRAAAI